MPVAPDSRLHVLAPPYRRLTPSASGRDLSSWTGELRGTALIWMMQPQMDGATFEVVRCRPPGVPLLVVLPPSDRLERPDDLLRVVELARPHSVLPHHPQPNIADLTSLLSRSPDDLAMEVADYLVWRGIVLDPETRRVARRIVELSSELRTVSALARSLYLSRRALGRRFMKRGLPVPSHWLQMARLLRAAIRLQNDEQNLFIVAAGLGYPDGFSLSNQMKRLLGVRPTEARERLGWEWLLEGWLTKEARDGGFAKEWRPVILGSAAQRPAEEDSSPSVKGKNLTSSGERAPSGAEAGGGVT